MASCRILLGKDITVPAFEQAGQGGLGLPEQVVGLGLVGEVARDRQVTIAGRRQGGGQVQGFGFSREIQQVMADSEGLYTGHPEVKYPTDKPKLSDLKLLSVDPEELEKRNEEIKKRFVEFFGA